MRLAGAQSSLALTSLKFVKSCIYKGSTLLLSTAQYYNHAWAPHSMQGRYQLMAPSIVWLPNPVWLFILQLQKPWSAKFLALAVAKIIGATLSAYKLRVLRQICSLRKHTSGTMTMAYIIKDGSYNLHDHKSRIAQSLLRFVLLTS